MDLETKESNNNLGKKLLILVVVLILLIIAFNKITRKDTWQGFYYPNKGNLLNDIKSPLYSSLEDCREWVNRQVARYNPKGTGYDYECGKNCKVGDKFTELSVCEETVR